MSLMRAPYKVKRKTKKNASLREDDDAAVDTVTHVEVEVVSESGFSEVTSGRNGRAEHE